MRPCYKSLSGPFPGARPPRDPRLPSPSRLPCSGAHNGRLGICSGARTPAPWVGSLGSKHRTFGKQYHNCSSDLWLGATIAGSGPQRDGLSPTSPRFPSKSDSHQDFLKLHPRIGSLSSTSCTCPLLSPSPATFGESLSLVSSLPPVVLLRWVVSDCHCHSHWSHHSESNGFSVEIVINGCKCNPLF